MVLLQTLLYQISTMQSFKSYLHDSVACLSLQSFKLHASLRFDQNLPRKGSEINDTSTQRLFYSFLKDYRDTASNI